MKKIILAIMLSVLLLVGCSSKSISFSGESKNWKGEFYSNIEDSRESGLYTFGFKNATNKPTFKNLEILINDGEIHQKEGEYQGATIKIPTKCSGCVVTTKDSTIKVTIKWNDNNEETFFLK